MNKALIPVLLLTAGCAAWTGGATSTNRFEQAAMSWTGAPLDEMIATYGPPRTFLEDSDVEGAGIVVWRSTWGDAYRCNIDAWYGPDRIVTRVDVTSHKCDEKYEEYLDMMMRKR
jgi:hypothetical protein